MRVVQISEAHLAASRLTVDSPLAAFTRTVCAREVRITLKLALAQLIMRRRRKGECRTDAPDDLARLRWREIHSQRDISQTIRAFRSMTERRLVYHRNDRARDELPIGANAERQDGLDVQRILLIALRSGPEIQIVLKRKRYDFGDWIRTRCASSGASSTYAFEAESVAAAIPATLTQVLRQLLVRCI
jgi:hypothetical protein